jgi:transcriptional regulator with GAF, ATPase, and Fis domain
MAAPFALGSSTVMRDLAAQVNVLAAGERTTVLCWGGRLGKGRVAELIHARSPRKLEPFVEVNCASLAAQALEVALFGLDVAASENGGEPRAGLFEVAERGTLFVDEIGELGAHLRRACFACSRRKQFRRVEAP